MSTFDGHIREFPDIQVDYFRTTQATVSRRPLACFLSHVHSDHLVGLDTLRSPFVYCSAATRALVLRLEKYPCRINFAKGILEARKRTYKHLKHLLKPLPLETPTTIELSPGNRIQVTLFDANHCPGSVMFLFEDDHKAALYTGDTRLEPWFVNSLVRSPCLAEYMAGLRTIDMVYLDTTFIERDVVFASKTEGIRELLQKVARYPPDTVFYMRAWTFGYEDVWSALAKALRSKIHVDEYKMRLFQSLSVDTLTALDPVAPSLLGFTCANTFHDGCLTMDDGGPVRIHSCERGLGYCSAVRDATRPVVWMRPVVCRLPDGRGEVPEVGAGGGGDDLNKEADLEVHGPDEVARLREMISTSKDLSTDEKADLDALLSTALSNDRENPISFELDAKDEESLGQASRFAAVPINVKGIKDAVHGRAKGRGDRKPILPGQEQGCGELPRNITFPYSRHSSYAEQCDLVEKLRPRDVWPCTVHAAQWFRRGGPVITIEDLFGRFCLGDTFRHDIEVASKYLERAGDGDEDVEIIDSQATTDPEHGSEEMFVSEMHHEPEFGVALHSHAVSEPNIDKEDVDTTVKDIDYPYFYNTTSLPPTDVENTKDANTRLVSHQAVVLNAVGAGEWVHIGLTSTTDNHTIPDVDLGSS